MSESGEDARLQRFIERERMGLTDEAKARIRELERVVAEKDVRIKELEVERLKDAQVVESARDLRWRQAIEALGADCNPDWTDEENRAYAAGFRAALNALDPEPLWQEANNE